ncbi:hypothetical protein CTheo_5767 [Ceratobasidium theobromae]|uniref:Uncharacterized protein n=1 Tax=Ceratobasidium theobromae TaxID=1582974 RepID=A0A5N5QGD0_9AGAM|nr:hypothetical protein CTheo_5767 [Ceratobasidium theobromae]
MSVLYQKYFSDNANSVCCFLITDTVNVWAEALDSKHTSHRARHAHSAHATSRSKRGFALPYHDADEEADWRRGVVKMLGEIQGEAMDGVVDLEIRESEASDLSVYISDTIKDFHWRWDVMSVRQMAPSILSKHMFMPLVTLATVTSTLDNPLEDTSEETLRTMAERKASTAKAMPAHHLRGFFSRPPVRTLLSCIAQVDNAPTTSALALSNVRHASLMSVDMADAPAQNPELDFRASMRSSSGEPNRPDGPGSSRKTKARDSTGDEDEGLARKIPRGTTPRRSDVRVADPKATPTPFRKSRISDINPDLTATESETSREWSKNAANTSNSRTIDEDDNIISRSLLSPKPQLQSPKLVRPLPRTAEKPKPTVGGRVFSAGHPPQDASDVFGETQTQTQASSDDEDREAELERRMRAAGTIGSVAVRTPARGGLGARMPRKKF